MPARQRYIRPEFWECERVQLWPALSRLAYIQLWSLVDDEGRMRASLRLILSQLLPYDVGVDKEAALRPIIDGGRLVFYEVDGQHYAWLPKFVENQTFNHQKKSTLPPPPALPTQYGTNTVSIPTTRGNDTVTVPTPYHTTGLDGTLLDGKGEDGTRVPRDPPPSRPSGSEEGKPAEHERPEPFNIRREVDTAIAGGQMGNRDYAAAREVHTHYRTKFEAPRIGPTWQECTKAIVRAVVYLRHDPERTEDPVTTLCRVVDHCASPATGWRQRGQGTDDRLHKFRSIFGDEDHLGETLGALIAESLASAAELTDDPVLLAQRRLNAAAARRYA